MLLFHSEIIHFGHQHKHVAQGLSTNAVFYCIKHNVAKNTHWQASSVGIFKPPLSSSFVYSPYF